MSVSIIFFSHLASKPYLENVGISPHVYPPSVTYASQVRVCSAGPPTHQKACVRLPACLFWQGIRGLLWPILLTAIRGRHMLMHVVSAGRLSVPAGLYVSFTQNVKHSQTATLDCSTGGSCVACLTPV